MSDPKPKTKVPTTKPKVDPKPKTKPKADPKPKVSKLVKVKIFKQHKCEISKVSYKFEKGKTYEVPKFVAIVLERAGVA